MEKLSAADEREKQTKSKSNQELLDLQGQIQAANQLISQLKRENVELKVQVTLNCISGFLDNFSKPSFRSLSLIFS